MASAKSEITWARRQTIGDLLRRTAARLPDKEGLVWRERRDTFADLNRNVNRVAHSLADRGIGKQDRVALFSHNCRSYVLIYFALARLGAVSVPINFMLGSDEVAFILQHSGVKGLVVEDGLAEVAVGALEVMSDPPTAVRGWIDLHAGAPVDGWELVDEWERHPGDFEPQVDVADDDPVQIMYTSGTESRPKGAVLSSKSLIAQYVSCIVDGEMSQGDVEAHALPLYHCAQLHCFLTPDVYVGARSVVLESPDPTALLRTVERERVTKLFAPPTVWISLLRNPGFDQADLSSLRKGYYGAAAMPTEVIAEIGKRLPDIRLWNFYGQTEMAPMATLLRPEDQMTKPGSAGRAALNVETAVLGDDDRPTPTGEVGEIVHRSPQAMSSYWNDPDKTADAFRGGWFHSGDLGMFDSDGYLFVVDRKKDMIKTGGENVASREVEEVIYRHPGVAEVAVVGISHPYWVEAVTAIVVPRTDSAVDASGLIAHCRQSLAGFKVPKYVVLADSLPKNPSGKILKRELRATYAHLAQP